MEKKLYRDENNKMIGGVAAGLAEYFDVDVTWARLAFILALFAGAGFLAYIVMWIVIPAKPFNPFGKTPPYTADYRVYEEKAPFTSGPAAPEQRVDFGPLFKEQAKKENKGKLIAGIILVSLGTIFLVHQLGLLPFWFSFGKLWPLALIIPGAFMLLRSSNGQRNATFHQGPPAKEEEKTSNTSDNTQNTDI